MINFTLIKYLFYSVKTLFLQLHPKFGNRKLEFSDEIDHASFSFIMFNFYIYKLNNKTISPFTSLLSIPSLPSTQTYPKTKKNVKTSYLTVSCAKI